MYSKSLLLKDSLNFEPKLAMTECVFYVACTKKEYFDGAVVLGAISGPLETKKSSQTPKRG